MATYSLEGLGIFIVQLFDKENEDELWQTWLHKEDKDNYKEFKNKYYKSMYKAKTKIISKKEEEKNIKNASKFIKPINKAGE